MEDGLVLCVINTAPNDPEVLRLYASFSTDGLQPALDAAIAKANARTIGAKLFTVGSDMFVAEAQMVVAGRDCIPAAEHLAAVLPRVTSMLRHALGELQTELTLHGIAEATGSVA